MENMIERLNNYLSEEETNKRISRIKLVHDTTKDKLATDLWCFIYAYNISYDETMPLDLLKTEVEEGKAIFITLEFLQDKLDILVKNGFLQEYKGGYKVK